MWEWHDGPDGWGLLWMGLMMAIVWVPLLLIIVWALREFGGPPRRDQPPSNETRPQPDAREIARRAYAGGDIDRERYLQIIEDLEQTKG
ncbi:MAG: hypothetical protein IT299_11040 [Dehalococcoidia bacterium]|nr:hypothetical protein [Dehalococcoidia bacterium]